MVTLVASRPVLLGMNNPLSSDPEYALFPAPVNCAGWRVWKMIEEVRPGTTRGEYVASFERTNLVTGVEWSARLGRENGAKMLKEWGRDGRTVIVLGAATWSALRLPRVRPLGSVIAEGARLYSVPHPSGRNLWYNLTRNRRAAARLLVQLAGLR